MKPTTKKLIAHLTSPEMAAVMQIQSFVLYETQSFFRERGFTELPPVITSPLTDPLAHGVHPASINYEGQTLELTKSMIFHKQLALLGDLEKIFIISPNVRLEKSAEAKPRHLLEFQQVDFEIKHGTKDAVYALMEDLITRITDRVNNHCSRELKLLKRTLPRIQKPFPRFSTVEMKQKYGEQYEAILSEQSKTPFWLESFYREFYDKEDPTQPSTFINYDLIYPEGFEEGLSGGEREYNHTIIVRKMSERQMNQTAYSEYLELAAAGLIPPTAGAGFGMQRLLRYLTGIREIERVVLFPRSPRSKVIF